MLYDHSMDYVIIRIYTVNEIHNEGDLQNKRQEMEEEKINKRNKMEDNNNGDVIF